MVGSKIMNYCIYKHTSPSGKSYIGQTKDYTKRVNKHLTTTGCRAFASAILKYGWDNFTHEILIKNITKEKANEQESLLIKEHLTLSPNGYNLTSGGDSFLITDETKLLMSKAQKGKVRSDATKLKNSMASMGNKNSLGHKHTGESKIKMSLLATGRVFSEETKLKMSIAATESNKGRKHSKETRLKIAEAAKTRPPVSKESIERMSLSAKNRNRKV